MRRLALGIVVLAAFALPVHADPVLNPANGHYYEVIPARDVVPFDMISWTSARDGAAALSFLGAAGHLATVTSQSEDDFIRSLPGFAASFKPFSPAPQFGDVGPWLGGSFNGTKWEWIVTGEGEFSDGAGNAINGLYEDWLPHEPNGGGALGLSSVAEQRLGYFRSRVGGLNNVIGFTDYHEFKFNIPAFVVEFEPIPEPGTLALGAFGVLGVVAYRRRRRRRTAR